MAAPIIQFKRGVLADLPGLRAGEPGFTTDSHELYVGIDSTTANNQFVGSSRFWDKGSASRGSGVKLVEATGNGTQFVELKAPDSLSGIVTYTMPGTDGNSGQVLSTNGSGELSFIDAAANLTIAADSGSNDTVALLTDILTFAGTGNEIETTVTSNQIQIGLTTDVTIENDLTVSNNIVVTGTVDGRDVLDDGQAIDNLVTLTGVAKDDTNLGTFTGAIISDNVGIKTALQEIETQLEVGGPAATVSAGQTTTDASFFLTFAATNNSAGAEGQETIFTDAGVTYNPVTNILTATNIAGVTSVTANDFFGDVTGNLNGNVVTTSLQVGVHTVTAILDEDDLSSDSDTALPTQQSVKAYVDSQLTAQDLDVAGDSGTGAVDLDSQSLTIAGTANEIETSAANQTITIGLPDTVNVTTALDVPTVEATNLKARDGTTSITITDSTGAVQMANNLTVTGNLIVNGSTTQVNTSQTTIEDQLLELGIVDGAAPTSDLNKDIGVIFNYFDSTAKKAAVYWDDSESRIVVSAVATESSGVMTNATSGALEIGSLFVNDTAGNTSVITVSGSTRILENITIDGGSF